MHNRYQFPCFVALSLLLLGANQPDVSPKAESQLQQLQSFIGQWRGVGQLSRGSTQGSWQENAEWKWSFAKDEIAIVFAATDAKHFQTGRFQIGEKAGQYSLVVTTTDGKQVELHGQLDEDGQLMFKANEPPAEYSGPTSVAFRQYAKGDRLVVRLYKNSTTGRLTSMGTIGYTRIGSNFGKGTTFVECVVTGGKGTIPVTYMGKTFYVCCGGCRDYFNDDPKRALEEYHERKAKEEKDAEK